MHQPGVEPGAQPYIIFCSLYRKTACYRYTIDALDIKLHCILIRNIHSRSQMMDLQPVSDSENTSQMESEEDYSSKTHIYNSWPEYGAGGVKA
jgi:hypothetical protein